MGVERDDLTRLVADVNAEESARSRARQRSLRQQATEEATLSGVLLDLAEARAEATIRLGSGRLAQGQLVEVGANFVVLRTSAASVTLLALRAISSVRRRPGERRADTAGARRSPHPGTFATRVASLAADRPRVTVSLAGEASLIGGELLSAGLDVLTVALDGLPAVTVYLAVDSVESISVSPPG